MTVRFNEKVRNELSTGIKLIIDRLSVYMRDVKITSKHNEEIRGLSYVLNGILNCISNANGNSRSVELYFSSRTHQNIMSIYGLGIPMFSQIPHITWLRIARENSLTGLYYNFTAASLSDLFNPTGVDKILAQIEETYVPR